VRMSVDTFTSDYAALQVQFQRRLSRGIQGLVSYTLASADDDVSYDHVEDTVRQRGPSDFDIRHNLSMAVTLELPGPRGGIAGSILGAWWIDGILRTQSGGPLNVFAETDVLVDGVRTSLLARRVPDVPLYLDDPAAPGGRRLNNTIDPSRPGCKGPYCPVSYTQYPALERNALRGPGLTQVDLSLRKRLRVGSRLGVEMRIEMFNVFNFLNLADPVTTLTSGQFGESTAMLNRGISAIGLNPLFQVGGPRSIQLAAKLSF
jgi:hypothetical protein